MRNTLLLAGSVAVHLVMGMASGLLPRGVTSTTVAISLAHTDKPKPPKDEPPKATIDPPKSSPSQAKQSWKPAATQPSPPAAKEVARDDAPRTDTASPPGMDGFVDTGLTLGGGSGPGGMAVPVGGSRPEAGPSDAPREVAHKTRTLVSQSASVAECAEPVVKPKPVRMSQPAYTTQARDAKIEGKVRVEVSVDAAGRVKSVRVLQGLGHGLDEAALAAARQMRFEPASRCGKPVDATFVVAMRFVL